MKRYISLLVILTLIPVLLAGCGMKTPVPDSDVLFQPSITELEEVEGTDYNAENSRPMVMINGELYYDTGRESDSWDRCGMMDGKILSSVDGTETPKEDNQSNFGSGYEYQFIYDGIDIIIDQKWMRFEKETKESTKPDENSETDTWGIELTAVNITPKGITLICNQSGGQPSGDLLTGSPFWLETKTDDQWTPMETLKSEYVIEWTSGAWFIPKNGSKEWRVNWERLYGELPAGNYRIGKNIMDFRTKGHFDTNSYYAYFDVED
jgi:predicted small lipoprotein YifL